MSRIIRRHLQPIISASKTKAQKTNSRANNLISYIQSNAVKANTSMVSDKLDNYIYGSKK